MAKKKRPPKTRTAFKKNYQSRRRPADLTRKFEQDTLDEESIKQRERVSGKGDMTRHRTIAGAHLSHDEDGLSVEMEFDDPTLLTGRVLRVHGLECVVRHNDSREYRCAVRQVLKSISTEQRHVVAAGDIVVFRPEGQQGIILAVRPRHGVLSRTSKGRRHILVTNVDLIIIVASAAQPDLKPHLIDRFLVTAEQAGLEPVIVINKADLVEPAELQPLVGVYAQMGYRTLLASAEKQWGIQALKQIVAGRQSVVTGQSGVGKSSLLNAIQQGLGLRVQAVSSENMKGKHTTTTAELIPLEGSVGFDAGYLVDTPGIRQLELWDVSPEEVAGLFRDIRPYVSRCRFPDCTHIHEIGCAVLEAVADGRIDPRRYNSYVHLLDDPSAAY
ncbi:MAG: ribosome small subunit-dependent GTPase A [Pirellulaceae bacterium]